MDATTASFDNDADRIRAIFAYSTRNESKFKWQQQQKPHPEWYTDAPAANVDVAMRISRTCSRNAAYIINQAAFVAMFEISTFYQSSAVRFVIPS